MVRRGAVVKDAAASLRNDIDPDQAALEVGSGARTHSGGGSVGCGAPPFRIPEAHLERPRCRHVKPGIRRAMP